MLAGFLKTSDILKNIVSFYNRTTMSILKKTVMFSGALSRSLIGIGAAVLLFCTIKKTKGKKKKKR
jgi:hypothetical protein